MRRVWSPVLLAAKIAVGTWLVFCALWADWVRRHWRGWVL